VMELAEDYVQQWALVRAALNSLVLLPLCRRQTGLGEDCLCSIVDFGNNSFELSDSVTIVLETDGTG
jgi:hypothetical protein